MKQSVGLSLTLSLSLALTVACGKKSSNKSSDPTPPTPGLVNGGTGTPVTGSNTGNEPTTGIPVTPVEPTTPVIPETPVIITPDKPIENPPVIVEPTKPVVTPLNGVWGVSLAQKPRNCSSIYDFRADKALSIHLLCPGDNGKSISLQTESYTLVADDGANASYTSASSTCGAIAQAKTLTLSYKINTRDQKQYLQLTENRRNSPELLSIPPSSLAGDLKSASTLYGRAVKRGCFNSGVLSRFEVKGAN